MDAQDPPVISMTQDRTLYAHHTLKHKWSHIRQMGRHLFKFYEILDAAAKALPCLKHVDLNLEIQANTRLWLRMKSSYKDGVIAVYQFETP
jgi:hypothetical protein